MLSETRVLTIPYTDLVWMLGMKEVELLELRVKVSQLTATLAVLQQHPSATVAGGNWGEPLSNGESLVEVFPG